MENMDRTVTEIQVWVEQNLHKDLTTHASEEKTVLLHYKWRAQPSFAPGNKGFFVAKGKLFSGNGAYTLRVGNLVTFPNKPASRGNQFTAFRSLY